MTVYRVNGQESVKEEIIRVDLEDIRLSEGGKNTSIVLSGHKTESYAGKTVTLRGTTYRDLNNGKLTYRCAVPELYLRPGDTVFDAFWLNF